MTEIFTIRKHEVPFVFSPFFTIPIIQLFVWSVGRNDIDFEWWKAGIVGLTVSALLRAVAFSHNASGIPGVVLALAVTGIPLWILVGYVYELSGMRRFVLSASCTGIVLLALFFERFPVPFPWND